MIDFIKNIFRRKFLRRYSSKQPTGLVPLSEIRSVSIVLDAQENGVDDCKEAALTYFKSKGMKVNVYFLDLSKKGEDERQITSLNNTILRKDLNWYGRPALEIIEMISSDGRMFCSRWWTMWISLLQHWRGAQARYLKSAVCSCRAGLLTS